MIRVAALSGLLAVAPLASALEQREAGRSLSGWSYYKYYPTYKKTPPPPPPGPTCGNGVMEGDEECDDGNTDSGDGCSSGCTIEAPPPPPPGPTCGNGEKEGDEECDDGNTESGDGCSAGCMIEEDETEPTPTCGNGVVDPGEECEPPNRVGCDAGCMIVDCPTCPVCPSCGDGNVDPGETCDEGDANGGAACRTDCTFCGDGIINGGEDCDGGDNCEPDCTITPTPEPACGDGTVDAGETCDEGPANGTAGSACRTDCTFCGDGTVNGGEECDDGNTVPGDGCEPTCTVTPVEPSCGDGIVQPPEECDEGPDGNVRGGLCRPDCTLPPEECGFCKPNDKSLEIGKPVSVTIGWACEGDAPASVTDNSGGSYDPSTGVYFADGDLEKDLEITYGGVTETLHTSCSAPLGRFVRLQSEGQSKQCQGGCEEPECTGCFQILEAISEEGLPYCDLDCSQVSSKSKKSKK